MTKEELNQASNKNLEINVEYKPGCQVVMRVFVKPEPTLASRKKAIKSINKEISIPGFRKGRAPEALILKNYEKHVKEEWDNLLIKTAFEESTKLLSVYPMGRSSVKKAKVEKCSLEEGSHLLFEFESYPRIPEVEAENWELKAVEKKNVEDADVEEALERLLKMKESLQAVEDSVVQEEHLVDLDLDLILGSDKRESVYKGKRFQASKEGMDPWLQKLVLGMSLNESREGESFLEETASKEEKDAFEPKKYEVTVKSILKRVLPDLNDEFAKKVGAKDLVDLRKKLRERLEHEAETEVQIKLREQVDEVLLEKYRFDVPGSLAEAERRVVLKDKISSLKDSGKDDQAIEEMRDEIEKEAEEHIDRKLRLLFLLQKISDVKKISVSNQEVNQKLAAHSMELAMGGWSNKSEEEKQRIFSYFSSMAMEEKVKDYIIEQAKLA